MSTISEFEALLLRLLRIPSPWGEELAVADEVERLLREAPYGGEVVRHGNGVILLPPADDRPCLALVGHLDTVPLGRARTPAIDEDRIWGRGASDMKSGVACMLQLARRLPPDEGPWRLLHVFYDREEGPYMENGLEGLLETVPELSQVDCALVLEPTDGAMELGAMGSAHLRLTVRGKAAHSCRPWQGHNAIHAAAGLLADFGARPVHDEVIDGLTYRASASVTLIEGGRARNVVPDALHANVNVRFAPGCTPEEAVADIEELVAGRADVEVLDLCPAALPFRHHPIIEGLRAYGDLALLPKLAWTDVARFAERGIPAANFGPGAPALAHQDEEHVDRQRLAEVYELLEGFLRGGATYSP